MKKIYCTAPSLTLPDRKRGNYIKMNAWTKVVIVLVALVTECKQQDINGNFKRVCYYTNWSQYNRGSAIYTPDKIEPSLCTHIVYAFADLNDNHEIIAYEWNDDSTEWRTGMWALVNKHKETSPGLRTLLALGGWNFGSAKFTAMVSTFENRAHFISTTIAFLRLKNFDGFDCDWEYPGSRGSPASDKEKFVLFLTEFREAIENEDVPAGKEKLLLTAAVGAGKTTIDAGYNIREISKELDWVGLMSYDFHGAWNTVTGHNSPLKAASSESNLQATFNVQWAVNYWLDGGCPRNKLLVGMPTYGRTFTLTSSSTNGMGAPARNAGTAGQYTKSAGFLSYYEICQKLQRGATRVWDEERSVPYCYQDNLWIGYDDRESFRLKVQWLKQQRLAGTMVWALDLDDFDGAFCNQGRYPLLNVIKSELEDDDSGKATDVPSNSMTTSNAKTEGSVAVTGTVLPPTVKSGDDVMTEIRDRTDMISTEDSRTEVLVRVTVRPSDDTITEKQAPTPSMEETDCVTENHGMFPHPLDCSKFIQCSWGIKFEMQCGPGTVYNPAGYCDWPYNVPGCQMK